MPRKISVLSVDLDNDPELSPELRRKLKRQVAGMARRPENTDARHHRVKALAEKRLILETGDHPDEWCIYYRSRYKDVMGLVPPILPLPCSRRQRASATPQSLHAQLSGALVAFALEVLNDKRFTSGRKEAKD